MLGAPPSDIDSPEARRSSTGASVRAPPRLPRGEASVVIRHRTATATAPIKSVTTTSSNDRSRVVDLSMARDLVYLKTRWANCEHLPASAARRQPLGTGPRQLPVARKPPVYAIPIEYLW